MSLNLSFIRFPALISSSIHFPIFLLFVSLMAHYLSVHYYAYYCAPWSVWGYIQTLWRVESIQCKATRWLFSYSYDYLHHVWVCFGGACVAWVIQYFKLKPN